MLEKHLKVESMSLLHCTFWDAICKELLLHVFMVAGHRVIKCDT